MAGPTFVFCPLCGLPLVQAMRHGALRPTCTACGYVHFHDPKVAVVALVVNGASVLLIRRGVPPGKGLWALPGGFMDADELPEAALQRELREEAGITVPVGALLAVHPLRVGDAVRGIVLAYGASVAPPQAASVFLVAGDDVTDARWFHCDALPAELAFDSTRSLLAAWAAGCT